MLIRNVTRQGALLVIVAGIVTLLAALVTTFLLQSRSGIETVMIAQRQTQARMMLHAACAFILEKGRIGWGGSITITSTEDGKLDNSGIWGPRQPETFGWLDVRDALSDGGDPLKSDNDGIGWIDPMTTQARDALVSGSISVSAVPRGSLTTDSICYDFNGPKFFTKPIGFTGDWGNLKQRHDWIIANLDIGGTALADRNKLFQIAFYANFRPRTGFTADMPNLAAPDLLASYVNPKYRADIVDQMLFNCLYPFHDSANVEVMRCPMFVRNHTPYAISQSTTRNLIPLDLTSDPPVVTDVPKLYNKDPEPAAGVEDDIARLNTQRLGWFRVKRIGPARFLVTCGAGGSLGYKNWQEVATSGSAADQTLLMGQPEFDFVRSQEVILWYEIGWSAAIPPAITDKPIEIYISNTLPGSATMANVNYSLPALAKYQELWSGAWYNALGDQTDRVLRRDNLGGTTADGGLMGRVRHPLPMQSNVCGTISYIQRLRQEPADW